jgi:GT2 family glycosyltransferase
MWVAGWKVIYCPMVTVVHYVGGSSVTLPFRSNFEFHKNFYRLYSKYAGFFLKVISPLVFGGIAMRFFFVLAAYKLKNCLNRRSMGKAPSRSSY